MNPFFIPDTHLRVCRACHSQFRIRRRLASGLSCLVLAAAAIGSGIAMMPHPLCLLLIPGGVLCAVPGIRALRPSRTCTFCRSQDTARMGPDGGPLPSAG